eukprot:1358788-Amorphochlora_amoeboformis.AAC.3
MGTSVIPEGYLNEDLFQTRLCCSRSVEMTHMMLGARMIHCGSICPVANTSWDAKAQDCKPKIASSNSTRENSGSPDRGLSSTGGPLRLRGGGLRGGGLGGFGFSSVAVSGNGKEWLCVKCGNSNGTDLLFCSRCLVRAPDQFILGLSMLNKMVGCTFRGRNHPKFRGSRPKEETLCGVAQSVLEPITRTRGGY